MFRYKLRTLLIVLTLGPPVLAGAWLGVSHHLAKHKVNLIVIGGRNVGSPPSLPFRKPLTAAEVAEEIREFCNCREVP